MSSPRRVLIGLVLVVALIAAACSSGDGDSSSTGRPPTSELMDASASSGGGSSNTSTAGDRRDVLVRHDVELDLPRSMTYSGLELWVTEAVWSNATPATFLRDQPSVGEVALYLTVTTSFLEGFPGDDGFMPVRHFVIETSDGRRVPATGVDHLAELPVLASAHGTGTLSFGLSADDLDGAVLVYDDGERVPGRLPLVGKMPDSPYPVRIEMGETAEPELATGCQPARASVTLTAVEWDLDGGVAVDGTKLARGRSSRVDAGHRWLRAEFEVAARAGACGGTFANHETFRVEADGRSIEPVNVYSLTLADGEVAPMTFLFAVPAGVTEVEITAGARTVTAATFEIEVPDLP